MFAAFLLCAVGLAPVQFYELPPDGHKGKHTFTMGMGSGMDWSWTFKKEEDTSVPLFSCVLECEGKKHPKHDACDATCDKRCPATNPKAAHYYRHNGTVTELGEGNDPPKNTHTKTLNDAFDKFGFPSTFNAERYVSKQVFTPPDWSGRGVEYKSDHWNTTPCCTKTKTVKAASYIVTVEYRLWDKVHNAQGLVVTEEGPKGTIRFRLVLPKNEEPTSGDPIVNCKCEVKQEEATPKDHGYIPGFGAQLEYAYVNEGGSTRPLTGTDTTALFTNVSVHDMNNATVSFNSWDTEFFVPAGWEFECIGGEAQDVQLIDDFYYAAERLPEPLARALDEKRVRVHCLNVDKPEPQSNMKYRLVPPRNALIQRAAALSRDSRFRGPWDQMRLWIATDQASYDKIADVLVPTPGQSTYLSEMHRLAQVGAIDVFDSRYLAILDLQHAFAPQPNLSAIRWMLETKFADSPEKVLAEFKRSVRQVAAAFDDNPDSALSVVSLCAEILCLRGGDAGVTTAIWLVDSAVPQSYRSRAAQACGDSIALSLERTQTPQTAVLVLEYFEKSKPQSAAGGLLSMNPNLPEALRQRGEALSAALWAGKAKG